MVGRREYTGRLIMAGETRTMTGGGGYVVAAEAVRAAIEQGLFDGLACFSDHSAEGPSVRRLVGVWHGVRWDAAAGAAVGRLLAYETAETRPVLDLLDQWLDAGAGSGERAADLGVSLVFYPRLGADGRTVQSIVMVESADLVMFPASEGSRIVAREGGTGRPAGAGGGMGEWSAASMVSRVTLARVEGVDRGETASHSQSDNRGRSQSDNGSQTELLSQCGKDEQQRGEKTSATSSHSLSGNTEDPAITGARPATRDRTGRRSTTPVARKWWRGLPPTATSSGGHVAEPEAGSGRKIASHSQSRSVPDIPSSNAAAAGMQRRDLSLVNTPIQQEKQRMKQEMIETHLPRVTLVRDVAQGVAANVPPAEESTADWLEAIKTAAASAVIRTSGLPAAVQDRLGEGRYESAEDVYAAVERARGELAALNEAGVVRLGGSRRSSLQLRDPLDEARGLMGFFFGAADGVTPPPNMRSFSDLYVALTGDVHFRGVFDGDRTQFSAATTATLPNLAVDAMNRVVAEQFQALALYRWYERIVSVEPNDGRLHDMKWITLGGIGDLPSVAEGASYTEMSLSDVRESASFVKRGGYIGITREMIKNSDVMQLQAIPRALATAAIRSRSAAVSEIFTANAGVGPTLAQDSLALFETNTHKNLLTTALGSDATAWRAARAECFQHVEVESGKPLAVFPRFLLVPAELYDVALAILGYGEGMPTTYAPEAQDRGFADPRPIPLVVPDWTDATDWAYIVDPAVYPVIQMSYSQAPGGRSHPAPELFAVTSQTSGLLFTNDTLPIKVRDEFAVGVNGPRGIGKRNVSGS